MVNVATLATRVSEKAGFGVTDIIAIISEIINIIQQCKKPANADEAGNLLMDGFKNHRKKCPLWFRKSFRDNGVQAIDDIHDLWGEIVNDAMHHRVEYATVLV
jgi:hypothetical protein